MKMTVRPMAIGGTGSNLRCTWTLSCPNPGGVVSLTFEHFDTESLYDGPGPPGVFKRP